MNGPPMTGIMRYKASHLRWGTLIFAALILVPFLFNKPILLYSDEIQGHGSFYQAKNRRSLDKVEEFFATTETIPRTVMPYMPYPATLVNSLAEKNVTGYLLGNASSMEFKEYEGGDVDLRIILIVYDRSESLEKCLTALNEAVIDDPNDRISLEVWIDRSPSGDIPKATYKIAEQFKFAHGLYRIHMQPMHIGIQGQWTNTWRPRVGSKEVGLILEDDITVSWYFWRWLKAVHHAYHGRTDISGYSLAHPGMAHETGNWLEIPPEVHTYLYRVICTWGFAPQVQSWRRYQEWFYETEQNATFLPIVPNILPTKWFLSENKKGKGRDLWEIWHICYTHYSDPAQYTVLLNTPHEGLLAVNRHETGLHDSGGVPREPLCVYWKDSYIDFPDDPPKIDYDGRCTNANLTSEEWS